MLVGFSSTYQDQAPLLQRVVDALSSLAVLGVVTLGQMLQAGDVAPSHNVTVIQSAPHGPILREASVAVTHCGHGTVMKALTHGVPMVCIPMGRDQNDTAARVVHHGAGVRLSTAIIRHAHRSRGSRGARRSPVPRQRSAHVTRHRRGGRTRPTSAVELESVASSNKPTATTNGPH